MQRLGVFALIGLLIATSIAVEAESDGREKGDGTPAEESHDAVDRGVVAGREEQIGWRESEGAAGGLAAVEKSAPLAAAESVETAVVMTRAANEGDEELEPFPVTSYKYHTVVRPDPDVAAELLSYITSPPPEMGETTSKRRRKRKRKGDDKLRKDAVAQRRAHIDERTFSELGGLFVGKNSRPSSGGSGSYNRPSNQVSGNALRATRRPQEHPDDAYGSPQGTFRVNPDGGSVSTIYGSTQSPAYFRNAQATATADSYGSPQGPVHEGTIYQDQFQPAPDSYGSPQSAAHHSSDSYGSPLGGVVTHQAQDGYGAPQGEVIHGGGAPPEYQSPSTGYDAPQDESHRPPSRRPNTRRPGRGIMRYLRGAMRGARDSLDSMGDSVLSSMRRLANRLRGAGSGGGGSNKRPQGNQQEHQQRPDRPRPPRLQLPQIELPRLPQLNIPTQLPPLNFPQIPQIRLPQIKLPRPQLPQLPQIRLPRPQLPDIKLPRPLTQIQLPRPIFQLPSLNFPRPGKQRPGGGGYQTSQPESHGGYPQSQVTCGTSPAPIQYGVSSSKVAGDEDRYEAAAAAAAGALGNPFLRAERNTVDSREGDMKRLREAWLLYRGAMLAYEQKYNVDDPALLRFKKEVLSSQALGFSASGPPFESVGIPKLVEENGERGFAQAQAKRDTVITSPQHNPNPKGPVGLLGPGYSFMLYPKEAQYRRRLAATSRNDTPVSTVDGLSREAEEDDLLKSTADPFDIALSPENVGKLSKYEKILTPLLYGGTNVVKRRGHRRVDGSKYDGAEESAESEV